MVHKQSILNTSSTLIESGLMKNQLILSITAALLVGLSACTPATSKPGDAVTLIITFEASEQRVQEFSEIMAGVSDAMASEPGFMSAKVYRNVDDPNIFVLEEVWATKQLHEEHFNRINQSGDWSHINSLLIEEPVMGYYKSM